MEALDRYRGCLIGLACGDAVGTTVEFSPRDTFAPVTDMTGGGPFGLNAGEWTDDTSMALCLATSLVHRRGTDLNDQISRYVNWWQGGYLSVTGNCFDIVGQLAGAHDGIDGIQVHWREKLVMREDIDVLARALFAH